METKVIGKLYGLLFAIGVFALLFGLIFLSTIAYKMKARKLGVHLTWAQAVGQRIRKTLTDDILEAAALANTANLTIDIRDLETHKLAGGSPTKVIQGLIDNQKYGLTFSQAQALDLAGLEIQIDEINRLFGERV